MHPTASRTQRYIRGNQKRRVNRVQLIGLQTCVTQHFFWALAFLEIRKAHHLATAQRARIVLRNIMRDCFAKFGAQGRMMGMNFLADGNAWAQYKGFFKTRIGAGLRGAFCKKRSYTDLIMRG